MTCDSCGRDLPPDARFCPGCGTPVAGMRGHGEEGPATAAEPVTKGEAAAEPEAEPEPKAEPEPEAEPDPKDAAEVEAADADDEQDALTPEALADEASGKPRRAPATIGNVLAVAAGGTLGVLVGLAIRQAM